MVDDVERALLQARAMVLHDLAARGADVAELVDVVEQVVDDRRWWAREWPDGPAFVAGQVAQDVQDRLIETEGRWPTCALHEDEPLQVEPAMGPDPRWVCERGCGPVAAVGDLPPA